MQIHIRRKSTSDLTRQVSDDRLPADTSVTEHKYLITGSTFDARALMLVLTTR